LTSFQTKTLSERCFSTSFDIVSISVNHDQLSSVSHEHLSPVHTDVDFLSPARC